MRLPLLFVLLFTAAGSIAQLDGWNKGKGVLDLAFSASYQKALAYYNADGEFPIERTRNAASLFAAYGITRNLDVSVGIPFVRSGNVAGLQDAQLFLKWLPVKKGGFTAGAGVGVSTPMTNYGTEGINAIGQQAIAFPAVGILHYKWSSGLFASAVGGYIHKLEPVPSQWPLIVRIGLARTAWYGEVYLDKLTATSGGDYRGTGDLAVASFRQIGVSYTRVGAKYYKPFAKRWGAALDVNYAIAGRNADRELGVSLSLVRKFSFGK